MLRVQFLQNINGPQLDKNMRKQRRKSRNLTDEQKDKYAIFYKICIAIPIMISLALVSFMIFFLSPRGESVRMYQQDIFDWNKMQMSEHMDSLAFKYKIVPYVNNRWSGLQGQNMLHEDTDQLQKSDKLADKDQDDQSTSE